MPNWAKFNHPLWWTLKTIMYRQWSLPIIVFLSLAVVFGRRASGAVFADFFQLSDRNLQNFNDRLEKVEPHLEREDILE